MQVDHLYCAWDDDAGTPAVRRRRRAAELLAHGESTGKSGDVLTADLRRSSSKISRYEMAMSRSHEVEKPLDCYELGYSGAAGLGARRQYLPDLLMRVAKQSSPPGSVSLGRLRAVLRIVNDHSTQTRPPPRL